MGVGDLLRWGWGTYLSGGGGPTQVGVGGGVGVGYLPRCGLRKVGNTLKVPRGRSRTILGGYMRDTVGDANVCTAIAIAPGGPRGSPCSDRCLGRCAPLDSFDRRVLL